MRISQQAFLLPVENGECFCIHRAPAEGRVADAILHLPAFGDEMNKSRAMTARAARAFAARGFSVLQIDLHGCGDSSGEHADATLARWSGNARCAIEWLRERSPAGATLWLWPLRAGALLVTPLLADAARDAPLLLWQPVLSGAQQLNHLLRQKLAGALGDAGGGERSGAAALRDRLRSGEVLESGGYAISPALADELDAATLSLPHDYRGRAVWLEVLASATPSLAPVSRRRIDEFRAAGIDVTATALEGPGFWQSVELERCDALIEASLSALTIGETSAPSRDPAVV